LRHGKLAAADMPVMFQGGTRDLGITPSVKKSDGCYSATSSPAYFVELNGAGHFAWTDLNGEYQNLVNHYSITFFDRHLRNRPTAKPSQKMSGISDLRSKYLVGAEHPHKFDARRLLERSVALKTSLVTDTEVFQEILHRYVAINRTNAIRPAFDVLLALVEEVYPVELMDVQRAREDHVVGKRKLSARDAIHAAIMDRHGVKQIMSFDGAFDSLPGFVRIFE
jgi:predicted nucleic acid-binding protein